MKIKGIYETTQVFLDGQELGYRKSCKVFNHSPSGFAWGYGGSGPAQLALAILMTRTDNDTASRLHQSFKWEFIATLPKDDFSIDLDVDNWLRVHGAEIIPSPVEADPEEDTEGECTFPQRCFYAEKDYCDCACNGANHKKGKQLNLF